jgi:hypothetical protein
MPTTAELFPSLATLPMEPAIAEIFARKFDPTDRNALAAIGAAFNELVTNEHATVESKVTTGTQSWPSWTSRSKPRRSRTTSLHLW